jgi:hypothetical protein
MDGGFVERQAMHGGPEVQDVAVGGAILVKTMIEVFAGKEKGTGIAPGQAWERGR